ncbi:5-hydroxyisourate hydrolase [Marchantia polymorpha subsp. ruderalis]|uniref:Hydroxyisourate hydrolase n=2 Tax=Marchantia polymorpha TaxID=3197 RepID=A0AAF6BCE5_MARPO|nr:hypothetical protein MARPO_0090s0043 [Marchantia polymorpha]BBN09679.1 hypothetical protein Mp_4g21780 [Marchantia polymorpha subsp. ruderalis]|eukprot:PTQ33306.1 hypothetical protein MARPO_0090s0043 [Marchantia polymorpha]
MEGGAASGSGMTMEAFHECCGSSAFASEMMRRMPFTSLEHAVDTARIVWWNEVNVLGWLEAFAAHPRIGDVEALRKKFPSDKGWTAGEQSSALATANEQVLQELAEWNKLYEAKFGFIFLICATGKPSHEILAALKKRFTNLAIDELRIAAQEQQKITELRLAKLNIWRSKESGVATDLLSDMNIKDAAKVESALRPPITTHVLDVSLGKPGAGIDVKLERSIEGANNLWEFIGTSATDSDGRAGPLMEKSNRIQAGTYRLTFETGNYLSKTEKVAASGKGKSVFYPFVHVVFQVQPHQVFEHFHVPLLFSPYSYTTYRGS